MAETLESEILRALRRITRAIDLHSRGLLSHYGLTTPQLSALRVIAARQPITSGQIARELHLGYATVTGILDRLERRGLIRRQRAERDRRSVLVSLTDEAARVLADAPSPVQQHFAQRLGELPQWEQTQILATLQRVAAMMECDSAEPTFTTTMD